MQVLRERDMMQRPDWKAKTQETIHRLNDRQLYILFMFCYGYMLGAGATFWILVAAIFVDDIVWLAWVPLVFGPIFMAALAHFHMGDDA